MPHAQVLIMARRHTPYLAAVAVAIVFASLWPQAKPPTTLDSRCESWDFAASAVLADLIADRSEFADARLGDATFRLRRARQYCRNGFVRLARLDYDALLSNRYKTGQQQSAQIK